MLIVIINAVRLVCEVLYRHTKKSQVSPPHPKCPLCYHESESRPAKLCTRNMAGMWEGVCDMTSYDKPFVYWEVILAARNMWVVLNVSVNIPLGCLGREGRDFWGRKECAQGVFVVSELPGEWGGAERQLGTVWLVRVRACIKPQRRDTGQEERVWPELPPSRRGGKIGLLEAGWVCWGLQEVEGE